MFNLSAIVGSAILYGDFKKAKFHQLVTFPYGCGATFAVVFLIAWSSPARPSPTDEEEAEETDEDDTATLPGTRSEAPSIGTATPIGGRSATPSLRATKHGSLSRRRAPTLVIPDGANGAEELPVLRTRHSMVSLYGFSPAQVRPSAASSSQHSLTPSPPPSPPLTFPPRTAARAPDQLLAARRVRPAAVPGRRARRREPVLARVHKPRAARGQLARRGLWRGRESGQQAGEPARAVRRDVRRGVARCEPRWRAEGCGCARRESEPE